MDWGFEGTNSCPILQRKDIYEFPFFCESKNLAQELLQKY